MNSELVVNAVDMPASAAEITRLKELYLSTPLKSGTTIVAVPAEFAALAREVVSAIEAWNGEKLDVIDSASVDEEVLRKYHTILLGNANHNFGTYELYRQRYTWVDGYLPGKGRYHVHTAHNPYATGTNAVVVAGSDDAGTARAVEKFVNIIRGLDDDRRFLPRINETDSRHRPFFAFNGEVDNAAAIGAPMAAYCFTNDPVQGKVARSALRARREDIYADCNGHDFFFRGKSVFLFWDLVEEGEVFTDEDRLVITNMLLTLVRHASQEHHGWHCRDSCPDDRLMQNHASHAALTFFWGARYFKKYYGYTEFDDLLLCVDTFFDMCFRSCVNQDDCGGYYYWPGVGHCLAYDAHTDSQRMLKSGFLQTCSQRAVAVLDNLGCECGYGETPYGGRPLLGNVLRFGARFLRDPQLKWLEHWLGEPGVWADTGRGTAAVGGPYLWANPGSHGVELLPPGWLMMVTDGVYAADIEAESPERYTGVLVVLLSEYFAKVQGGRPGYPYFDKISFRDRFDPESEYLCLDGYWAKIGVHRDADANAIIGLTWKGCRFLVDGQHDGSIYFRAMPPSMHNCAVVKRIDVTATPTELAVDGIDAPLTPEEKAVLREAPFQTDIPPLATLKALGNFKRSGIARSLLADYGGMDWTRNILWMRGRAFVVIDDFVAKEGGIFEVSVYWQTLGDGALHGGCFSVSQELDESVPHPEDDTLRMRRIATFHIDSPGGSTSSIYPDYGYGRFASYGNQRVTVLQQTKRAQLEEGEQIRIANLLYATSDKDSSKDMVMEIEEREDGVIVVREKRPEGNKLRSVRTTMMGATDVPLACEELSLDAGAFIREGPYIAVAGAKQVYFRGERILDASEPTAVEGS